MVFFGMENCDEKYKQNITKLKTIDPCPVPSKVQLSPAKNNNGKATTTISSANTLTEFLKPHSILSQNSDEDDSEIDLLPLKNQVGGHTRLLLLNDKTVVKPLNIRELEFYQNIPNNIQQFVPKYKGE